MGRYDFDLGIIGGGAGGLTVASGAAQLGAGTLLIEKEPVLGGDCLHYGCVPSKTLIRSAQVFHLMRRASDFGLPHPEVGPVDFRRIVDRIRSVIAVIQKHDSPERFCRLGVQVAFGTPSFVDEHAVRLNGKTYSAGTWIIATGSSPALPPIQGLQGSPFLTNKEIFYLDRLPGSMVILGAGPVGCEMAQSFSRFGTEVRVVDMASQILVKEDRDLADLLRGALEAEGVRFHLDAVIEAVRHTGNLHEVDIRGPDGRLETLRGETLLVALGREPNTGELGLEKIGVAFDRGGIRVDRRLRTNHRHIYAVGDVNGTFPFTHAAGYQGGIVVSNAVFRVPRKADYRFFPWCTFTDPALASIGMNEKRARAAGVDCSVWVEEFTANDRGVADGRTTGRVKLILDRSEKPIGVQILGPDAGDLLAEWVVALNGGIRLTRMAAAVHPYPTLSEINRKIAGMPLSRKLFSDRVRKGLKLLFKLQGRACHPQP